MLLVEPFLALLFLRWQATSCLYLIFIYYLLLHLFVVMNFYFVQDTLFSSQSFSISLVEYVVVGLFKSFNPGYQSISISCQSLTVVTLIIVWIHTFPHLDIPPLFDTYHIVYLSEVEKVISIVVKLFPFAYNTCLLAKKYFDIFLCAI